MSKVLVVRLSSLGDVALLVPAVFSVAQKYPQSRFTVLTRSAFAPLFENLCFNVNVIPVDLKHKHKGLIGGMRIIKKLLFSNYSVIADEHDVLRTKILRWAMMLSGRKVRHINKERGKKKRVIETKVIDPPLKQTVDRYMDVFEKLGYSAEVTFENILEFSNCNINNIKFITGDKDCTWIGIAPFAKHRGKIYPLDKMEKVVETLAKKENTKIFLFGAGKEEREVMENWIRKFPNIVDIYGRLDLQKELILMSYIDVMLTMDSANMHLASLVQTPVVSIWGATHPSLGFYGFAQDQRNAVQIDLDCRPCSTFGDKPCQRKDYACLNLISEDDIVNKIESILEKQ